MDRDKAGTLGGEDGFNIIKGTGLTGTGEERRQTVLGGGRGDVSSANGVARGIMLGGTALLSHMSDDSLVAAARGLVTLAAARTRTLRYPAGERAAPP